ncbi:SDR family oxidoreductase [Frondihabitans sp. 762G35]|uniref:SDR family oxidoreductase n=1 Tax=Frondihabitans sp. 762G35 TaxID=1446794 RepID=UPI0013DB429C|nr:SDR family NAD(P)-dependent oxidoreductase [Frondihabitans sp. 762G35]
MSDRLVWISGAGSGIGRAAAVRAAAAGYDVALSGRRREALDETARLVTEAGGSATVLPVDVTVDGAVEEAAESLRASRGPVTDLVLAAGLNAPARTWADQSLADFTAIVDTNLVATARFVDAVLPGMRAAGGGTVVVVSSFAAWSFQPGAGVAYSASKTALGSLCRSLNDQGAASGVRACHLCPGDVDTDFLSQRPSVPDASQRLAMLTADDVARTVQFVLESPPHVRIDELVVSPVGLR